MKALKFSVLNCERGSEVGSLPEDSNCKKMHGLGGFWIKYIRKSISELQMQVATYVCELSVGNCHRKIAALSSFIVMCNDRYAHDCKDRATVTR